MKQPIPPAVIEANRQVLQSVPQWITRRWWEVSRYGYGIPGRVLHLVDRPWDNHPTITDLLVDMGTGWGGPVDYLELGVSVGKNFLCMARNGGCRSLSGLDWEEINPVLAERLVDLHHVRYIQGDEFAASTWDRLGPGRFNLVFSDAMHTPEALRKEWSQLRHRVDRSRFAYVWDDLGVDSPMATVAGAVAYELAVKLQLHQLNGWLGQHEGPHWVGVATNHPAFL